MRPPLQQQTEFQVHARCGACDALNHLPLAQLAAAEGSYTCTVCGRHNFIRPDQMELLSRAARAQRVGRAKEWLARHPEHDGNLVGPPDKRLGD